MAFFRGALAGLAIAFGVLVAVPPAAHGQGCWFVLGFATLHDLIPAVAGDSVDNESHAANADGVQNTAHGLRPSRDRRLSFTFGLPTATMSATFPLQTVSDL